MRILRRALIGLAALVVMLLLASVTYNALTSDPNVPVSKLWQGRFQDGTAFREWGSRGSPIVLLGGFLEPSFVWSGVGPILGRRHRVFALDLDGFGYSERRGPWTLAHWADQVQAFIRSLHLGRPAVVGHSVGAAVAVELATRGAASRIVLLDGDALPIGGPPGILRSALAHSPFFTSLYRIVLRSDWIVRRVLRNAYGPRHPPLDSAELRRWTDQFRAQGARQALQGLLEHGIAGVSRPVLQRLKVPARVVWGARDGVDPVAAGRRSARDLRAPFVLVPGVGHLSLLEAPRAVARAILG